MSYNPYAANDELLRDQERWLQGWKSNTNEDYENEYKEKEEKPLREIIKRAEAAHIEASKMEQLAKAAQSQEERWNFEKALQLAIKNDNKIAVQVLISVVNISQETIETAISYKKKEDLQKQATTTDEKPKKPN